MRLHRHTHGLLLALTVVASFSAQTAAQRSAVITITGRGGAMLVPTGLEARFELAATADTATGALEALAKKYDKAIKAIKKLPDTEHRATEVRLTASDGKNRNTNVQIRAIGGAMMWMGGNVRNDGIVTSFSAGRTVIVNLENLGKLSSADRIQAVSDLLEKSKEVGLSVVPGLDKLKGMGGRIYPRGSSSSQGDDGGPFSFIGDKDAATRAAQKAALEDARAKAELLASLTGKKLGPVKTIRVVRTKAPSDKLADGGLLTIDLSVVFHMGDS